MIKNIALLMLVLQQTVSMANTPHTSIDSIVPVKYTTLPVGSVKPKGWLLNQLKIMRDGTTGHLDEVYARLKDDNGWMGGKKDDYEETPYWLDGAVPLAYLLDDKRLQEKVLKYINWTIDNQRASGYFGPITKAEREQNAQITPQTCDQGADWWPKMVMLKVMQQYYSATGDKRVITFMTKYFHYQLSSLKACGIGKWSEWSASRGTDNEMIAQWLYKITSDPSLLELAALIESQCFPWTNWLGNRDWVIGAAAQQNEAGWMSRHAVNVGMALKSPAINYQRTGNIKYLDSLKTGFKDLMHLHGLPMGIFSGDEDLHGNAPSQGVELCTIVESMFSLEKIIAITGDIHYMDALERMTFNALPTQTTDDYNAKQYYQIPNQVNIARGAFNFSLPLGTGMTNVLGMRSGYTCCLANMHQGWTKFADHLWFRTDDGIAALHYAPSLLKANLGAGNNPVTINEVTNYPFEEDINFEITTESPVEFPFLLRIPSWCDSATISVNGKLLHTEKGGQIITLQRTWKSKDRITLRLPMKVITSNWGRNSRTIERGPLVYALKIKEKWEKGNHQKDGDYFSVFAQSDWNYGLLRDVIKDPSSNTKVTKTKKVTEDFVWNLEHAPIEITTRAKKIPDWKLDNGVAHQPVTDRFGLYRGNVNSSVETITLVPYGCTKLRIVAFPVVE